MDGRFLQLLVNEQSQFYPVLAVEFAMDPMDHVLETTRTFHQVRVLAIRFKTVRWDSNSFQVRILIFD